MEVEVWGREDFNKTLLFPYCFLEISVDKDKL